MAIQPWRTGKVIRIENATYNTRRYWFEIPELSSFDFEPGQFVQLDFPIHEKPAKRWRSYSIASWPDGTNVFELVIVLVEDGAGTPWLFNNVVVGSEIPVRGPQGVFTLHEENLQKIFFLFAPVQVLRLSGQWCIISAGIILLVEIFMSSSVAALQMICYTTMN